MPSPRWSTQPWIVVVALVLAIAGCTRHTAGPEGDILATLAGAPINVEQFDANTLRGKPSLVLFVTPTCPHCRAELPEAQAAAQKHSANVVAVFIAGKKENATGVLDTTKFTAPALLDDGTLRRRYGIRSVPYTLVLGPDGKAREQFIGEQTAGTLSDALDEAR